MFEPSFRAARPQVGAAARLVLALLVTTASCSEDRARNPVGTGESKSSLAGFAGGHVSVAGAALTIPVGVLRRDVSITVTSTRAAPPEGARTWSPVFKFEPEGLLFSGAATLEIDLVGAGTNAVIVWSTAAGGYEKLATQVAGGKARAAVTQLRTGFVADGAVPWTAAVDAARF